MEDAPLGVDWVSLSSQISPTSCTSATGPWEVASPLDHPFFSSVKGTAMLSALQACCKQELGYRGESYDPGGC